MSLYGGIFHHVVFPAWEERLRHKPTMQHLRSLEATQWLSQDELVAIQERALARLVDHAIAHVPYWRQLFRERGLEAHDVRAIADLAKLPLLTKDAANAAGDARKSTAAPFCDLGKLTGGTTGSPLRFGYDLGSEHWRHAIKLRGWGWAGYRVGDRTFYYWGPATNLPPGPAKRAKIAADRLLKRELYVDCTNRSPQNLDDALDALVRFRPERMICYTQAGVDLAARAIERGLEMPQIGVLCCAERLDVHGRNLLEAAFGKQVFETYGCREVMLIGTECEAHDGLHLSMENLIVEVLVREGDRFRAADYGETGEIAITDLHNWGMPFIRYLNGDLGVQGKTGRCACGRGLARLAAVEGRVAETLRDADGAPVCGILLSRIFSWSDGLTRVVRQWQAVQHVDGSITLKLDAREPLGDDALADLRRNFQRYMKGVPIRTELVPEIPLGANGKRRVVVVEKA
jgi:phenylacetate-CoA ligase